MEEKSPIDTNQPKKNIVNKAGDTQQDYMTNTQLIVLSLCAGSILPLFLDYVFQTNIWGYLYCAGFVCVFIIRKVGEITFEYEKAVALQKSPKRLSEENRKKFVRTAFISMPLSLAVPIAFFWIIYLVGRRNGFHELSITGIAFFIVGFLLLFLYALWGSYIKLLESQDKGNHDSHLTAFK
jgi:hypothetical protein